MVLVLIYRWRN